MKILVLSVLLCWMPLGWAAVDAKQFDNPQQEKVYNDLISELRCLVCQNQNIADSNAALAGDLRRQVYEMIQQGKTRQEIVDYMLDRYGDYVLYRPPFRVKTGLLWIGPFLFLAIGIVVVVLYTKRRKNQQITELSAEQQQKIRRLLEKGDD